MPNYPLASQDAINEAIREFRLKDNAKSTPEYSRVPDRTLYALLDWKYNGRMQGGFLTAVFENDLRGAVWNADRGNANALFEIVKFVLNRMPAPCWGTKQKVKDWSNGGGMPVDVFRKFGNEVTA